jgi:hypothetical protein
LFCVQFAASLYFWDRVAANATAGFRVHAVQRGAQGELGMVCFPEFSELLIARLPHAAAGLRATTKRAGNNSVGAAMLGRIAKFYK